ncbi:hypothetical protein IGI04_013041 [Brassica rapa subsp. trilocularis]|uniref:Uncharacterized protein n=1 Tax=Brassica rapa subsp. trilocularis TaxID=1813537 RepID=A0ABQ7N7N9_BRACM|nr:hypothetical protein IGI04_013041 [Brassica rapa subsp. trilocularis]
MSIEMLLIDEADTLVQGCVSAVHQHKFRERLAEGSVYTLSGFDVTRSNPKFKLSDGPVSIRFNEGTDFEKLAATAITIPTEHFRFRTHEQILELANTSRQLPYVIGEVRAIRSTITDRLPRAQRVMLTLRVERQVILEWNIRFKDFLLILRPQLEKIVLSSYRLPGGGADETWSSSKVVHAQKIEPLTVAELNEFVLSAEPQESSFTCPSCNETNVVAELKYRVVFSVSGPTGTSSFLGFDKEVAKLTNVLASEAAQIVGIGISAHVYTELPRTLAGIIEIAPTPSFAEAEEVPQPIA